MDIKQKRFEPILELHISMEFDHRNEQRPEKELAVATDISTYDISRCFTPCLLKMIFVNAPTTMVIYF